MPNPLGTVRVKIDRAKKHLTDLEAAIKAFEATDPYSVVPDKTTNPGHELHRFYLKTCIPVEWGAVVGDCVHNLRSALDYLARDVIVYDGGTPWKKTAFPIAPDATNYTTSLRKSFLRGAKANSLKLFDRLKPYGGGGCDALDRLHRVDIADKHQLLIPVAAAHKMFGIRYDVTDETTRGIPKELMMWGAPTDRKFPLKNGDILFTYIRVKLPFEDHSEFKDTFEIAFGEGQVFDGEPVVPTLAQLVEFVERVVDIFARRIFGLNSW